MSEIFYTKNAFSRKLVSSDPRTNLESAKTMETFTVSSSFSKIITTELLNSKLGSNISLQGFA